MSRQIRRLKQQSTPDKTNNESSEEEEYIPLYVKKATMSTFSGLDLEISSASENENKLLGTSSEEEQTVTPAVTKSKKKSNKQKRKKRARRESVNEVAKCVSEVNAILGEPSQPIKNNTAKPDLHNKLFSISRKNLLSENELNRRFGPGEKPTKRNGRRPNLKYIHTYTIVSETYNFERNGLSMLLDRREGGISFFIFEHSLDYRIRQRLLPTVMNEDLYSLGFRVLEVSLNKMHIEGLIVAADKLFRMEKYDEAYEIIEKSIAYVQYFAHPGFNLTDINVRLEYRYVENRMFHILLLKYAYMTSNKACHRTGLELVKVLYNLDQSDPLGVVLIIDGLALRAKEYDWLIQAIDYLNARSNVCNLCNIKFSRALAYFHQANKGLEEMDHADELLQEALLMYPWALQPITEHVKSRETTLRSHEFYNQFADNTTGDNVKQLLKFYLTFTASQWRKPSVMEWFLRNALTVTKKVDYTQFTKKIPKGARKYRRGLFRVLPANFQRHFAVISSMANFVMNGEVPPVKFKYAYDPLPPPDSVSRSGYPMPQNHQDNAQQRNPLVMDFFHSLFPSFRIHSDDDDEVA